MRGSKPSVEEDTGTDAGSARSGPVGAPLIVLGMHRSGTSAMAGALSILGIDLGEPLMEPRDGENTRGYFEHLEIYEFHQRLLKSLVATWDDLRSPQLGPDDPHFEELRTELKEIVRCHFSGTRLWAVKDPRACRFVPLWDAALAGLTESPRYVIIFRHPDEVAASLARRNRFSRDKSDLLWADHYLAAEAATRGARRAFSSYADLLRSPEDELARISREIDIEWPTHGEATSERLKEFLSDGLRHHRAADSSIVPRGRLRAIVPRLWRTLETAASSATLDETTCDALRGDLSEIQASFDPLWVEHFSQLMLQGETERRVAELEGQLARRSEWIRVQDEELENQRATLKSIEDQLEERTRWLQIQDEILHRQIARIDALEGLEPPNKDPNDAE